jgi:flagella synthesis protein FlgN
MSTPSGSTPSGNTPNIREVHALIAQDIQTAEELCELLAEEHQALKDHKQSELNELLTKKQQLMTALGSSSTTRNNWLAAEALSEGANNKGTQDSLWAGFLSRIGGPKLIEQWHLLEEKINQCKSLNETNGIIISRGQKTMKQLLNIIRGHSVEAPKLYTASGNTRLQQHSQSISKA